MRCAALIMSACAALAGCSSSGELERTSSTMAATALAYLFGTDAGAAGDGPAVSRAQLDAIAGPVISVRRGDGPTVFVRAEAVNRETWVTYRDTARRGITLRGAAIGATDNFGLDVTGIATQSDDPLVTATPVDRWPEVVTRAYKFHRRDAPIETLTFRCTLAQIGPTPIDIVERRYETVEVLERCTNGDIDFENRHWAERDTGFIWRSTQWIGPRISPVTFEIINPYAPG